MFCDKQPEKNRAHDLVHQFGQILPETTECSTHVDLERPPRMLIRKNKNERDLRLLPLQYCRSEVRDNHICARSPQRSETFHDGRF